MDLDPADRDDRLGRGERLVLELADDRAIHGVGAARAEALDVEQRCALADLLVGREGDAQRRARHVGVRGEVRDRRHDLRDARLVVSAEQRVAAGADDVVADLRGKLGHPLGIEHRPPARERDRPAVVGAVHDRLDARTGLLGARVDMRDQPDGRRVVADRRRQLGHDVAVVVELGTRTAPPRRARRPASGRARAGPAYSATAPGHDATACRPGRSAGSDRGRRGQAPRRAATCRRPSHEAKRTRDRPSVASSLTTRSPIRAAAALSYAPRPPARRTPVWIRRKRARAAAARLPQQ